MKPEKFTPAPGQVDFTHVRWAPVVNCVLCHEDKILLVKRSHNLRLYPDYWNGISGFLDDDKNLTEKVHQEVREETGLTTEHIVAIKPGTIFDQEEPKYGKTWIVHPVLVEVNTNKIKLDWEAADYQWVTPTEATKLKLLPGFGRVLRKLEQLK